MNRKTLQGGDYYDFLLTNDSSFFQHPFHGLHMSSVIESAAGKPSKSVRQVPRFTSVRTIGALILREMNTSYGRSPGGYIWAVLQPAAGIGMMVAFFSAGFRAPPLGTNFALFYATGLLPFMMFTDLAGKIGQALNYSKAFLAYPRITFMDAIIGRFILNTLTQLLVSYILIASILFLFETRTTPVMGRVALTYAMVGSLSFGIGVLNCFLTSRFRVWQQVWSILMRPMFLISGIFFMYDDIPEPYRSYLWYNPVMHITGEMRAAFYVNYGGDYVSPGYVFSIALVTSAFGLLFLRRYHRDLLHS
ncbi:ABC transporter permease [Nioella sp. MMSF_3534]|uniref:ABC transporter permease n=1 Tax=Nioella sp. MMSF_3534 TaxID=3046720 RepID=UPI00273E8037|nr:ABC transporter permease [Nioella sp. MMSF_3534]